MARRGTGRSVLTERDRFWLRHLERQAAGAETSKAYAAREKLSICALYLDRQWPKLIRYLDDGRIPLDTNLVENAIRPFAVGRKNWLFADTVGGAEASANLYSVIQTAKANGLEPFAYLCHLFAELPKATRVEDYDALLPHRLDRTRLRAR